MKNTRKGFLRWSGGALEYPSNISTHIYKHLAIVYSFLLYVYTHAAYHISLTTQSLHHSVVTAPHAASDIYYVMLLEHSLVIVSFIISLPLLVRYVPTL